MPVRTFNLPLCLVILCLSLGGCAAPLVTEGGLFSRASGPADTVETSEPLPIARTATKPGAGRVHSQPDPSAGAAPEAMGQVLDDLEEIRSIDRRAQQRLLAELKKSPAEKWPLMVAQFRSALEHREELRDQLLEPTDSNDQSAAIDSWRNVARRALISDDEAESRAQPLNAALLGPADMAGDDPLAVLASLPPTPPRAESDPIGKPRPDDDVAPALYLSGTDDRDVEPAIWREETARPLVGPNSAAPARLPADPNWEQHLRAAIQALSLSADADPETTTETADQVRLRLLQLVAQDTDAALTPIPQLTTTEQSYWTKQLFALATYTDSDSHLDPERRAALAARHLEDALGQLRVLSSLRVQNLAFCESVYDFGAYEPCPTHRFTASRQVTLYAEVENYHSRLTEKGYHTSLASTYEVVNEQGERISGGEFPQVEDYCRSRRRDFHIQYTLPVPGAARPGNYRLKLNIVDNLSGKEGQNAIEFQIVDSRIAIDP